MQNDFEAIGGIYREAGDYLLPNIESPESPQIGIWGELLFGSGENSHAGMRTKSWTI